MTDHKAEALSKCQQIAGVDQQTNQITLAIEAQVHATLALAAEQRTANLIALHEIGSADPAGAGIDGLRYDELREAILTRLGLIDD